MIVIKTENYKKVIVYKNGLPCDIYLYNDLNDLFSFLEKSYKEELLYCK